ncbi:MAG: DUF4440 domain-containing protein [Gammaproteobacteria bacterium]|nr:DUF4440 domain-containing protein [Gammaproteobacteria bacterium]
MASAYSSAMRPPSVSSMRRFLRSKSACPRRSSSCRNWMDSADAETCSRAAALVILLPTVSNVPRLTPESRRDYFEMFLKSKPQGVIDSRLIQLGCNSAIDAGIYTFTFGDGRKVQARFTYTYGWDGKQWLITSHHSSAMPEPVKQ